MTGKSSPSQSVAPQQSPERDPREATLEDARGNQGALAAAGISSAGAPPEDTPVLDQVGGSPTAWFSEVRTSLAEQDAGVALQPDQATVRHHLSEDATDKESLETQSHVEHEEGSLDWVDGRLSTTWFEEDVTTDLAGERLRSEGAEGSASVDLDLLGGALATQAQGQRDQGTSRSEWEAHASGQVGGGASVTVGGMLAQGQTDGAGEAITSSGVALESTGGVVAGEDGRGVAASQSASLITGPDESVELGGGGQLTDKGAAAHTRLGASRDPDEGAVAGAWVSADGAVRLEIVPTPQGAWQLRCEVQAGLGLGGEAGYAGEAEGEAGRAMEREGRTPVGQGWATGRATATGSLSARGAVAYTRLLGDDEVDAYVGSLDAAQRTGQAPSDLPEVGLIASLRAAADSRGDGAPGRASALRGDSASAAAMRPGEGFELTLSAGGSVGASAGGSYAGLGADVGASAGASVEHRVRVERTADQVVLTLSRVDAHALQGQVGGSVSGLGLDLAGSRDTGEGTGVTLVLDPTAPDFDAIYAGALACPTEAALRAYTRTPEVAAHVAGWNRTTSRTDASSIALSAGAAEARLGTSATVSSDVAVGDGTVEGTVTGSRANSASLAVGTLGYGQSDTDQATGNYKHGQRSFVVSEGNSSTELERIPAVLVKARGLLGLDAVKEAPGQTLQDLLTRTRSRLLEYRLDDSDVLLLLARAKDEQRWSRCCTRTQSLDAWEGLRKSLRSPRVDSELAAEDPRGAEFLAQAEALCSFVSEASYGAEIVERALRQWGELTADRATWDDGEQLGDLVEWSDATAHLRGDWEEISEDMATLEGRLSDYGGEPAGLSLGLAALARLQVRVERLEADLVASHGESARARVEMLSRLALWSERVATQRARLVASAKGEHGPARVAALGQEAAAREVARLEGVLAHCRDAARPLVEQLLPYAEEAEGAPPRRLYGPWEELHQLVDLWILERGRLQEAYVDARVDPLDWKVQTEQAARIGALDPDPDTLLRICLYFQGRAAESGDLYQAWKYTLSGGSHE